MPAFFEQDAFDIRFEWGAAGLQHLLPACRTVIIVDVLSFTTCVEVAVSRGALAYPYLHGDESARVFAKQLGAELADARLNPDGAYRLSPSSLMNIPAGTRVILPSPNGATLSLSTGPALTLAGCLRNARATAQAANQAGGPVLVLAAGERWPDGSLRPALEDQIGAGAVIACLEGRPSPEAAAARSIFQKAAPNLEECLQACSSGKELAGRGRASDTYLAAALNVSTTVPVLIIGAYYGPLAAADGKAAP